MRLRGPNEPQYNPLDLSGTYMRPCPICGDTTTLRIGDLQNTFRTPLIRAAYDLAHCKSCDVVYLSPLPLQEDLETIYCALQFDYNNP
jgi:hypothetical protein